MAFAPEWSQMHISCDANAKLTEFLTEITHATDNGSLKLLDTLQ